MYEQTLNLFARIRVYIAQPSSTLIYPRLADTIIADQCGGATVIICIYMNSYTYVYTVHLTVKCIYINYELARIHVSFRPPV